MTVLGLLLDDSVYGLDLIRSQLPGIEVRPLAGCSAWDAAAVAAAVRNCDAVVTGRKSPALPPEKIEALGALQSGLLDKLWLAFDEVFWDPDVDVINWIDPVNPGHWPVWVNGYKIFGEPILLGFNSGDVAREFAKMSDDELVASAMAALTAMTE